MPLDLIFNTQALRPPITGVGNYTYHLLQEVVQLPDVDQAHCFTGTFWQSAAAQITATEAMKREGAQMPGGWSARLEQRARDIAGKIPGAKRTYDHLMQRRFTAHAEQLGNAIYHEPNYILQPFKGPCVTTVHDLSHIRFPQFHQPHVLEWLEDLPRTLERADAIITPSQVVADELVEHFAVPSDLIHAIYEGVDASYAPRTAGQTQSVLSDYHLSHGQYVLLVATLEPRKGVDVLLTAWQQLPESVRRDCPLVLAGSSGWHNEELRAKIESMTVEGTVRRLGYVPSAHLPDLMAGAAVFAYPSVYEGFGLPVLDAMSCSVPVICRAGTSMAEFADGACLLCETGDADELALRLAQLLDSAESRESWGRRGLAQAEEFSWQRCAGQTAEIYRSLR